MSARNSLQRIDHGDGVTVIDERTGATGEGETYSEALESLVTHLHGVTETVEQLERLRKAADAADSLESIAEEVGRLHDTARLMRRSQEVRERFEEKDVTEEDVQAAIEWARSR